MADATILLSNGSLKNLIKNIDIDSKHKKDLLSELNRLDFKGRMNLFILLTKLYLLDKEEMEATEKIDNFFKKLL